MNQSNPVPPISQESNRRFFSRLADFLRGFGGEFISAVLLGWFVEFIFALSSQQTSSVPLWICGVLRTFTVIWFASGAAFYCGTLTGFIFGFPKTRSVSPSSSDAANLGDNTNLEEVSDWLTKIIVGLGLVEFEKIRQLIVSLGDSVAKAAGNPLGASPIAIASMIYGFVCGFLYYYVWARIRLWEAFESRSKQNAKVTETKHSDLPPKSK